MPGTYELSLLFAIVYEINYSGEGRSPTGDSIPGLFYVLSILILIVAVNYAFDRKLFGLVKTMMLCNLFPTSQ